MPQETNQTNETLATAGGAALIFTMMLALIWFARHAEISRCVIRMTEYILLPFAAAGFKEPGLYVPTLESAYNSAGSLTFGQTMAILSVAGTWGRWIVAAFLLSGAAYLYASSIVRRFSGALSTEELLKLNAAVFPAIAPAVRARLKPETRTVGPWRIGSNYGHFAMRYGILIGSEVASKKVEEAIRLVTDFEKTLVRNSPDTMKHAVGFSSIKLQETVYLVRSLHIGTAVRRIRQSVELLSDAGAGQDMVAPLEEALKALEAIRIKIDERRLIQVLLWQLGEWQSAGEFPAEKRGEPPGRFLGIEALRSNQYHKIEYGLLSAFAALSDDDQRGMELLMRMAASFREGRFGAVQIDLSNADVLLREHEKVVAEMATRHAYITTLLMGMLKRARSRAKGGLAPSLFRWVRPAEYWRLPRKPKDDISCRPLWYALRSVAAPRSDELTVVVEGLGPMAHFQI